jgi:uncharacterized membrane protein YdbT with pleckstrin-like domain
MLSNDSILLKPALLYAILKIVPLITLALLFLVLAWCLSPSFLLFSLAASLAAWFRLLYIRSFTYLITRDYIRLGQGIFFRRTGQAELFRIKDYVVTQTFLLQLCRLMSLSLKSTDSDNAVIVMKGIPESDLVDTLREWVQAARKSSGIMEIT